MDQSIASFGTGLFRRRKPLITRTYGKRDSKPLRLNTNHFRRDPYAVPPDEEGEQQLEPSNEPADDPAESPLLRTADEAGSESSALSDGPDEESDVEEAGSEKLRQARSAGGMERRSVGLSSTSTSRRPAIQSSNTTAAISARPSDDLPPAKRAKATPKAKGDQHSTTRARRRLPVNELLLVTSPMDNMDFVSPQSSPPGVQTQDPISEQESSSRERDVSPTDSQDQGALRSSKKQPISIFRNRLQSNKHRYKSVDALRERQTTQSSEGSKSFNKTSGDGFDDGEMFISPLVRKAVRAAKKSRPRQHPLIPAFGALQLQGGPLPDVEFETAPYPLKVEEKAADPYWDESVRTPQRRLKQVSFSSAQEQAIMAELASISAPPLPRPVSDDEDGDSDEEDDEDEEEADQRSSMDGNFIADGFQAVVDEEVYEVDTEAEEDGNVEPQKEGELCVQAQDGTNSPEETKTVVDEGVSLDFRRCTPGQLPRRRIRQDDMVEVNDNIIEISDSEEPFNEPMQWTVTPDQASEPVVSGASAVGKAPRSRPKRPRSILKNTGQSMPESSTHASHTAANTRRNSTIRLSESRYFNDASELLENIDPAKHKIVPRRRRSSYFDDVEMLDSGAIVPETSPSPEPEGVTPDYTAMGDLAVLRKTSGAEWTSQSLPAVPRDLRALTRSVSREHGTLSQSRMRKSSLPFQSPRKVR